MTFQSSFSLYSTAGGRKYLNRAERNRVLDAAYGLPGEQALFLQTLFWTGARISEVLQLTPACFQLERSIVALPTLKRRRPCVREIPLPPALLRALDRQFDLANGQHDEDCRALRLWRFHRVTAWRIVKGVMNEAGVSGHAACPRGLRHGFGVGTLQAGVPLHLLQRWLGHARIGTTAIYADVTGAEEIAFAERFWRETPSPRRV